jgi:hypothetical protein
VVPITYQWNLVLDRIKITLAWNTNLSPAQVDQVSEELAKAVLLEMRQQSELYRINVQQPGQLGLLLPQS